MFSFFRRKNPRHESSEIVAAREYLNRTHQTLAPRDSDISILLGHGPFNYLGSSRNGEYTRYYFCEGSDKRIIYVVLCDEEREKVIKLFWEKMRERTNDYKNEFIYKDSLKGMFVGEEVKHRFFSNRGTAVGFMSDDGEITFGTVLEMEDMD